MVEESGVCQIYPRPFNDSNGDGIGDIAGILERVEYDADDEIVTDLSSSVTGGIVGFTFDVNDATETELWGALNTQ